MFEELLAGSSRKDQEAIWEITRFPDLIDQLVDGGIKSKREITRILQGYPEEIHESALRYGRIEYDLLARIYELNRAVERQFESLIAEYAYPTQDSYRALLQHPDILTLLSKDMNQTVLLGDTYNRDPGGVRAQVAEMNLAMASRHATQNSAWTTPQADNELQTVAQVYQQKYAYDDSGFDSPESYDREVTTIAYHGAPYPYWFGYPRWYGGPHPHASLAWYVTPRVRASVSLYPSPFYLGYRTAVRHYVARPNYRHRHPVRVKTSRSGRRGHHGRRR